MIGGNPFLKKGYGRIYVLDPLKIARVLEIVREVDPLEFEVYYPKAAPGIVAPWEGKVELVHTYKYEACMDTITLRCWRERIPVWCISQREESFGTDREGRKLASVCLAGMCDHRQFGRRCPDLNEEGQGDLDSQ